MTSSNHEATLTLVPARDANQLDTISQQAAPVLQAQDPITMVKEAIRYLGYGGDLNPPLITYLALSSRLLAMRSGTMPVHLLLLGQPSAGKSYSLQTVLKLIPPDCYNKIDAGSPKVFIYDEFNYRNRIAIFSEADSLPAGEDNAAASAMRNMLQDHHLHYKVTERDQETGQFVVRDIDRPGPTVLITTAVRRLGAQLDSRMFSLEVPDDHDQIQAALDAQAHLELEGVPEPDPALIAYQSYLQELAPWHVLVPFAKKIAKEIGRLTNASRIMRDYSRLISMIKTVAILRHRLRRKDATDRLIAEIDDYALVHELVSKMYETSVTKVSDKIRNVLRAVTELRHENVSPVSETKVAERLGCVKQAITQAVKTALIQRWLINRETRKGYPFDLVLGEPLPQAVGLPDPASLEMDQEVLPEENTTADVATLQFPDIPRDVGGCQPVQPLTGGSRELYLSATVKNDLDNNKGWGRSHKPWANSQGPELPETRFVTCKTCESYGFLKPERCGRFLSPFYEILDLQPDEPRICNLFREAR